MPMHSAVRSLHLSILLLATLFSGCELYSDFMAAQRPRPRSMPTLPAERPVAPNLNQQLLGQWSATYPEGQRRVTIQDNPRVFGTNYVATLVDGRYGTLGAGAVVFQATPDGSVPTLVTGTQFCSDPRGLLIHARMTIVVTDTDNFIERLVDLGACSGFPVKFTRIPQSSPPQNPSSK
jgi:hypothetical protein